VGTRVVVQHHGVDPGAAEGPDTALGRLDQGPADAVAAALRVHREAVQVAPPAVPAGDDRADDPVVLDGHDQRVRVPQVQRRQGGRGVRRAAGVLGRRRPERQHGPQLAGVGRPKHEITH
jgi:hypothetical protein